MFTYSDISLTEIPNCISLVLYSPQCNLYCPWCFNQTLINKDPLSYKQAKDLIDEHNGFIDGVVFSGGEPLCNPMLKKTMKYASDCGLKIKLNTNGLVPDSMRKNTFLPWIDYLHISLKGFPHDYANIIRKESKWTLPIRCNILEYSLVYSPPLWSEFRLKSFCDFLNKKISDDWQATFSNKWSRPNIFTISQIQTGNCLDSSYDNCRVPSESECIEVAKIFKNIPRHKLIVETKEKGRQEVKI